MTDTRTSLITGVTDGFGRALADRLAAQAATLVLHARSEDELDRAAQTPHAPQIAVV